MLGEDFFARSGPDFFARSFPGVFTVGDISELISMPTCHWGGGQSVLGDVFLLPREAGLYAFMGSWRPGGRRILPCENCTSAFLATQMAR